ncbi:MAG: amidohydrolase family protein [Lentisphaeria bacterium]|nr:amidohydrolase family protein [Lentisphaeria bacterium]NQZ69998.1 amidohydrolase family protein [Lentisphaeria bacterium]
MSIERVVDTHVHLINPQELIYPWMEEAPSLNKYFGIEEFNQATDGLPITEMIFMEVTAQIDLNFKEVEWVESLFANEPRLKGIIARAAFGQENVEEELQRFGERDSVLAIRDIIQWEERGYANTDSYIAGVKSCTKNGLAVDLCIYNEQFEDIIDLAKACPDARLILDHFGKPDVKNQQRSPWIDNMKKLADNKNVYCKISGLLTEAELNAWAIEDFDYYLSSALDIFGIDRLVYGGDWPVSTLSGTYKDWFGICENFSSSLSDSEKDKLFYSNARDFYFPS